MAVPTITEEAPAALIEDAQGLRGARNFTVIASSDTEAKSLLADQLSVARGAVYQSAAGDQPDLQFKCQSIEVRGDPPAVIGGVGLYRVRAVYRVGDEDIAEPVAGGEKAYNWDTALVSMPADIDIDGSPIVNSSNEPFDPPQNALVPVLRLSVEWYVEAFALADLIKYTGVKNSDTWSVGDGSGTLSPGQAFITRMSRRQRSDGLIRVSAEVDMKAYQVIQFWNGGHVNLPASFEAKDVSSFDVAQADRGRRIKGDVTDNVQTYEPILDTDDNPVTEPVFLNGDGGQLNTAASSPVTLIFEIAKSQSFTALGI